MNLVERVYFAALKALLSLRSQQAVDEVIFREELRLIDKNRGALRPDQKRRLDMLKRWNDARP